jgi:hypothetical protein
MVLSKMRSVTRSLTGFQIWGGIGGRRGSRLPKMVTISRLNWARIASRAVLENQNDQEGETRGRDNRKRTAPGEIDSVGGHSWEGGDGFQRHQVRDRNL